MAYNLIFIALTLWQIARNLQFECANQIGLSVLGLLTHFMNIAMVVQKYFFLWIIHIFH